MIRRFLRWLRRRPLMTPELRYTITSEDDEWWFAIR